MSFSQTHNFPIKKKLLGGKSILGLDSQAYLRSLILVLVHIPLGLLLYQSSILAFVHPAVVVTLGLYWAVQKHVRIEKVAYLVAYLVGSEVLWRMAEAPVFWEFGKYAASLIMIVALIQRGYLRNPKLPLVYFVLLLPAGLLTALNTGLSDARGKISFNLSGPLALFVCCWFFSHIKLNWQQLKQLMLIITVPIVSIAVITLFFTITTPDIQFNTESNHALSGGFGPNQVSSVLGLGVFLCVTCLLVFKNDLKNLAYIGAATVFFAAQSVLTFSRTGIYIALGASIVVGLLQMRNLSKDVIKLIPVFGMVLVFILFVLPYMNSFTGGKLQERFEDRGTTNRIEIMESDFLLFLESPILGQGVGQSNQKRAEITKFASASHTEFTRMISEHGILGILSLIALCFALIYSITRQKLSAGKAVVAGVVAWSFLFMLGTGMRLLVPSFLIGLGYVTIIIPRYRKVSRKAKPKLLKNVGDHQSQEEINE